MPRGRRSPTSRALISQFPIYSPLGFQDSVDVTAGVVSGYILAVDQGMIMAAIANELAEDAMQHAFSDGQVERAVRPLLAMEEFSVNAAPEHRVLGAADQPPAQDKLGPQVGPRTSP